MAPNNEPDALAELFKTFGKNMPSDKNLWLERAVYDQVAQAGADAPGVRLEYTTVVGRPAIWARPEGASKTHVMLFLHGGGYTMGSPNGHRKLQAHLSKACNMPSLSIDYRLTPEVSFPTPLNDCVDAYKYLLDQGYSPSKIVTAGDSCGGALCTSVPLAARDRGLPLPGAVVSLSPWVDLTNNSETMKTNADKDVLQTADFVEEITNRYTAGDKTLRTNPLLSPLFADLKGMPPHYISCGGWDMLLDHGLRMGEKLKREGVEVVLEVGEGQQHVFEFAAGRSRQADESIRKIGEWVQGKVGA